MTAPRWTHSLKWRIVASYSLILILGGVSTSYIGIRVTGRALLHQRIIEQRTHAYRGPLELAPRPEQLQLADATTRRRFEKLFSKLRKHETWRADLVASLASLVENQIRTATP